MTRGLCANIVFVLISDSIGTARSAAAFECVKLGREQRRGEIVYTFENVLSHARGVVERNVSFFFFFYVRTVIIDTLFFRNVRKRVSVMSDRFAATTTTTTTVYPFGNRREKLTENTTRLLRVRARAQ